MPPEKKRTPLPLPPATACKSESSASWELPEDCRVFFSPHPAVRGSPAALLLAIQKVLPSPPASAADCTQPTFLACRRWERVARLLQPFLPICLLAKKCGRRFHRASSANKMRRPLP